MTVGTKEGEGVVVVRTRSLTKESQLVDGGAAVRVI